MPLMGGVQVVLQHPAKGRPSRGECRAFTGLPDMTSVWFYVKPWDRGDWDAGYEIGNDIATALKRLGPHVKEVEPPCGGGGFGSCHASDNADCLKVLLPVIGANPSSHPVPSEWTGGDPTFITCPIMLPSGVPRAVPASMRLINGVNWTRGDPHAMSQILQLGGLLSAKPRIFISYVRAETQALADQLHDHLGRKGFEVFLDRFSVKPGIDFQVKLIEELSRMGSVLLLESPGILKSHWVRHEINFAKSHRLGLMSLGLPGGTHVSGIDPVARIAVLPKQLTKLHRLSNKHLEHVLLQIQVLHADAERRRIAYLRDSLSDALLLNGFTRQGFGKNGVVLAQHPISFNQYAFAVSHLPPLVDDFYALDGYKTNRSAYVVAPSRYMDWRVRQPLEWVGTQCGIQLEDEGNMVNLVKGLP